MLLDPADGHIVWKTYVVPPPQPIGTNAFGPSGIGIWSTPTYDAENNTIYIGTGNNYTGTANAASTELSDAIVAFDASDGHIKWNQQLTQGDNWNFRFPLDDPQHPDYDFGDSPQLYQLGNRKVVGAGQKSGFYHVLDAATGEILDPQPLQLTPGGQLGGLFADSAVADGRVYADGSNWPNVFAGGAPVAGSLTALSGDGTRLLWQFATPSPNMSGVAVAANIVYFQSIDGSLYVLDAKSGHELTVVQTGGQESGPAVSRGQVYLGTGDILSRLFNPFLTPGPGTLTALGIGRHDCDRAAPALTAHPAAGQGVGRSLPVSAAEVGRRLLTVASQPPPAIPVSPSIPPVSDRFAFPAPPLPQGEVASASPLATDRAFFTEVPHGAVRADAPGPLDVAWLDLLTDAPEPEDGV